MVMEYVRDILVSLSAIAVAVSAFLGVQAWRKELIGKARFETAKRMWHTASEYKGNFEWVRNPLMRSFEWADRVPKTDETHDESEVLNSWHAKLNRLNLARESLNKVTEIQWEAEILFDDTQAQAIKQAVQSYRESYANVSSAVSDFYEIRLKEAKSHDTYGDQHYLKELQKIIFSGHDDEISSKVVNATATISQALKRYVR